MTTSAKEKTHRRLHLENIPHNCRQYPALKEPLVEPFVLAGKAIEVFKLIELKAKREQELNLAMKNLRAKTDQADEIIQQSLPY